MTLEKVEKRHVDFAAKVIREVLEGLPRDRSLPLYCAMAIKYRGDSPSLYEAVRGITMTTEKPSFHGLPSAMVHYYDSLQPALAAGVITRPEAAAMWLERYSELLAGEEASHG